MHDIDDNYYLQNLTPNNCNFRIKLLYELRDAISKKISQMEAAGASQQFKDHLEFNYQVICHIICKLCDYRSEHECALEGDKNYEMS